MLFQSNELDGKVQDVNVNYHRTEITCYFFCLTMPCSESVSTLNKMHLLNSS